MTRPVVVFAMEWVPRYRVPFYEGLRVALDERGIEMRLVHGDPPGSRVKRNDAGSIEWASFVANRIWTVKGLEITAQPVIRSIGGADLVVVQQETGLLLNYYLMARSHLGGPPVAVWGHGHNFNPLEANPLAERVKRTVTKWADWAFAYTERSAEVFRAIGMGPERITVVQNSTGGGSEVGPGGPVSDDVLQLLDGLRADGARLCWIVSALDRWKRVPFLLDALDRCAERIPGFAFVALGAGDEAAVLAKAADSRPWLHPLGARFGVDKAAIGKLAELTIHPGLIGLHVIDSFATETPIVTADLAYHSHEVAYLSKENAVVLPADADVDAFAGAVEELLTDDARLAELQRGCREAASRYTLEAMVENFADGIVDALAATGRR